MVHITLYHNNAENNRVDKTNYLQACAYIEGNFRDSVNVIEPIVDIENISNGLVYGSSNLDIIYGDNNNIVIEYFNYLDFPNYLYIEELNRYYFIEDFTIIRNNLIELNCSEDNLHTYKDAIKGLNCTVLRQEYNYDDELEDDQLPVKLLPRIIRYSSSKIGDLEPTDKQNKSNLYCQYVISVFGGQDLSFSNDIFKSFNYYRDMFPQNQIYVCNYFAISHILKRLSGDDFQTMVSNLIDPNQYILNIYAVPFDLNTNEYTRKDTISILGVDISFGSVNNAVCLKYYGDDNTNIILDGGYIDVIDGDKPINKYDYLYTSKYTNIELYIPYYGFANINNELLFKESKTPRIYLQYIFNITTGDCKVEVSTSPYPSGDIPICSFDVNVKTSLVYGSSGLTESVKKALKDIAGIGLELLTAGLIKPGSSSTQTKSTVYNKEKLDGRLQNVSGTSSHKETASTFTPARKSNTNIVCSSIPSLMDDLLLKNKVMSGINGGYISNVRATFIWLVISVVDPIYYPDYERLVGRPSSYQGLLSNLTGFTIVGATHIEGTDFGKITNTEREMIEEDIKSGIIL